MVLNITIPEDQIEEFCRRRRIKRLALFGSVLRDDFAADSDVDVLVEFMSDSGTDLFDMTDMEIELREIFGRKVDLRTPAEISRYFRQDVLNQAQVLYERQ